MPAEQPLSSYAANGINDSGEIIGNYRCTEKPGDAADAIFKGSGFYRAPDGTYYRVEYENAQRTVAGKSPMRASLSATMSSITYVGAIRGNEGRRDQPIVP